MTTMAIDSGLEEMDRFLHTKDLPSSTVFAETPAEDRDNLQEAVCKLKGINRLLHLKYCPPPPIVVAETAAGDSEKLQDIVHKLQEMDQHLQSKDCPPPTVRELRLYELITRHARHYILLFQIEQNSHVMSEQSSEVAEQSCTPSIGKDPVGGNLDAYIDDVNDKILMLFVPFDDISTFLRDCRRSLADILSHLGKPVDSVIRLRRARKTSLRIARLVKGKEEASQGTHNGLLAKKMKGQQPNLKISSSKPATAERYIQTVEKGNQVTAKRTTRELYLFDILQGLEEMRKLNSYAPPKTEDIHYYREIRKLTTSAIWYVDSKQFLQNKVFLEKTEGEKKWVNIPQYPLSIIDDSPLGYKVASFFDELLELESLLKESCNRFADIWSSLSEGNEMKDLACYCNKRIGSIKVGRSEEKEVQGSQGSNQMLDSHNLDAEVMLATNYKLTVETVAEVKKKKTREGYLRDISRVVAKMQTLCLKTLLTDSEVRLFSQIMKHVNDCIWMYKSELEATKLHKEGHNKCDLIDCDSTDSVNDLSDAIANDGEMKTREQYLQEIVLLVEGIQSSFLDTPPTVGEAMDYWEIGGLLSLLEAQWREKEGDKGILAKLDISMLNDIVKAILHWELLWSKDVAAKCRTVLSEKIIPSEIDLGRAFSAPEWIVDNKFRLRSIIMTNFKDLVSGSSHQLEMLNQSLIVLRNAEMVASTIAEKFTRVNEIMGFCVKRRPYVGLHDVCCIDWSMLL